MNRTATRDVEFRGQKVRESDHLLLPEARALTDDEIHLAHRLHDLGGALPAAGEDPAVTGLDLGHLSGL